MTDLFACLLVLAGLCSQAWLVCAFLQEARQAGRSPRHQRAHGFPAIAVFTGFALALPAHADEPTGPGGSSVEKPLVISTDRPSFDDTAGIVPKGHLQLETGYTFTLNNHGGSDTQTNNGPEILARYTIIDDRFELRVSTSGYVWSQTTSAGDSSTSEGFSDAMVGFKLKLTDQEQWIPRLVLEVATTVGAGSDGISNQDVEPIGKLIWQYDLGKGWGIYGNFNLAYAASSGERFLQGQGGVCVTCAATEKFSVYGEFFTFAPNAKGTAPAYYLDAGAAYLLTDRVQLDARVGFGLGRQSNNFFTGAGISFLF